MPSWVANFDTAFEFTQTAINNPVLERFLAALPNRQIQISLGFLGSISAELIDLDVTDIDKDPTGSGAITDVQATVRFQLRLFGFIRTTTDMVLTIEDVEVDLSRTAAGLPRGIVLRVTPTMTVSITFPNARFPFRFILNRIVGPLVSLGIWLAFRLIQRVEVPLWPLVDVFAALGLRYLQTSPLLTAQKVVPPTSVLLASDFNLSNVINGDANQLGHFLPVSASPGVDFNIGAVIHEGVLSAAVNIAFSKGWAPTRFRISGWKIYLNAITIDLDPDVLIVRGSLKAKRGRCFCRVKVRITFEVRIEPRIVGTPAAPEVFIKFQADLTAKISTSGMLAVLGSIIAAPLFLTFTILVSFMVNIVLQRFLPFTLGIQIQGLTLNIAVQSVNFSGFIPLSMTLPLKLDGDGRFSLAPFQQFQLGGANFDVEYAPESLTIQDEELRLAAQLK